MIGWLTLRPRGRHAGDQVAGRPDPRVIRRRVDRYAAWQVVNDRLNYHETRLDYGDARHDRQDARITALFDWLRLICEENGFAARPALQAVPGDETG